MQMYVQDPTPISLPRMGSCTHTGLCTWGTSNWTGYFSSSTTRWHMRTLATTLYQDKLPDMFSSLEKAYHPYIRHPHHTVTQCTPQRCAAPRTPFRPSHTPLHFTDESTKPGAFSQGGKGLTPSSFSSGWGHRNRAEKTEALRLDTFKAG